METQSLARTAPDFNLNDDHGDAPVVAQPDKDATVYGVLDDALMQRDVTVAFAGHRESKQWKAMPYKLGTLVDFLTEFRRGDKNGDCITQGALTGHERLATGVIENYLLMLDVETGESMDEVQAKVEGHGLFTVLWHTHSHLKTVSEVGEAAFVAWCGRQKLQVGDGPVLVEQMQRYLHQEKKYQPWLVETITAVDRDMRPGSPGVHYYITHARMPRLRALFVLAAPFNFIKAGTQKGQIEAWKDSYRGVAKTLDIYCDKSCIDPARLMYTPRIAKDADKADYEIRVIAGAALDLSKIAPVSARDYDKPAGMDAFQLRDMDIQRGGESHTFTTPGLVSFIRKHGRDFEVADWMTSWSEERRVDGAKHTFQCPNDDSHSNPGDPNDLGFFCVNASESDAGFSMWCSHATCQQQMMGLGGKFDRAMMLDHACQVAGVEKADDLLAYCPNADEDFDDDDDDDAVGEDATPSADDLDEAISKLSPSSDGADVEVALRLTFRCQMRDAQRAQDRIRKQIGMDADKRRFNKLVKAAEDAFRAEHKRARGRKVAEDDDNTLHDRTPLATAIADYNKRYAVTTVGSSTVIASEVDGRLVFQPPEAFKLLHAPEKVEVEGENKEIAPLWLKSPDRRTRDRVVFDPAGPPETEDHLNLFRGFRVPPVAGDWSLLRQHIFENICGGDSYLFAYFMSWAAGIVQDPCTKPGVALVMRGKKGTGKSKVAEWIAALIPHNNVTVSQSGELYGAFNGHVAEALFVNIEEGFWAGDKKDEGALKHLITGPRILMKRKFIDNCEIPSFHRFMISSNEGWVVPVTKDERRFAVFDVSDKRRTDTVFFAAVDAQMGAGGLEALMYDLKYLKQPSWIELRNAPKTAGLKSQIGYNLPPQMRWLREVVETGTIVRAENSHSGRCIAWSCNPLAWGDCLTDDGCVHAPRKSLHDAYFAWCRENGAKYPGTSEELKRVLNEEGIEDARPCLSGKRERVYTFPPRAELAKRLSRHGLDVDVDGADEGVQPLVHDMPDNLPDKELAAWRQYGLGGGLPA